MRLNKIAIAVSATIMGLSNVANAELSANIGATSNYLWRGVSQTGDEAAISGGIDFTSEVGFYAGTWVSTLGNGNGEEMDIYGGFGGKIESFSYDAGIIYYGYPSQTNADFTEVYGSVSFGLGTLGAAYTINAENSAIEEETYYYASVSMDAGDGWSIGGIVGTYDKKNGANVDYSHAQINVTKSAGDFGDFTLTVSKAGKNSGDDKVIPFVSWSKSF